MFFLNVSGADADKIVPQVFKDLISKSNGKAGLNILKSSTKLLSLIGENKYPKK